MTGCHFSYLSFCISQIRISESKSELYVPNNQMREGAPPLLDMNLVQFSMEQSIYFSCSLFELFVFPI
jgi:hypothetical protein